MESLAKVRSGLQPLSLSFNHHRSSSPKPVPFISLRNPLPSSRRHFKFASIKASSSSQQNPKPSLLQTLTSLSSSLVKITSVTVAAAALFFVRLPLIINPAIAAPLVASTVDSTDESTTSTKDSTPMAEDVSYEEKEKQIEQHLAENPNDIEALQALMEVKIKSRKLVEAVEVIDRLIELEPSEFEWQLLKAQVQSYAGETEAAIKGFEEILRKDPLKVEAYHGLVMVYDGSDNKLNEMEKRIEKAMEKCKKEKNKSDLRDFKLLIAQIRVMESRHSEALKVYEELVKEEPRDFRPYLCQGIIYTLLRKNDEAEKQFEKFRRLVPRNHPYREYFVDNMVATKVFGEKVERERMGSKSWVPKAE